MPCWVTQPGPSGRNAHPVDDLQDEKDIAMLHVDQMSCFLHVDTSTCHAIVTHGVARPISARNLCAHTRASEAV